VESSAYPEELLTDPLTDPFFALGIFLTINLAAEVRNTFLFDEIARVREDAHFGSRQRLQTRNERWAAFRQAQFQVP
jgi:hypothetical protein